MQKYRLLIITFIMIFISSFVSADLTENCIIFYDFNENTTTPIDSAGNSNASITYGSPTWEDSSGLIGSAYYYDGDDAYRTGYTPSSNSEFSVSAWIKPTGDWAVYTSYGLAGTDASFIFNIINSSPNSAIGIMIEGNGDTLCENDGFDFWDGDWHHVVIIHDRSESITYAYIDNTLCSDNLTEIQAGSHSQLVLAQRLFGVSSNLYKSGYIDLWGFWNYTLNESQIEKLYNSGDGLNPFVEISELPIINMTTNIDKYINSEISGECISTNNINNVSLNDSRFIFSGNYTHWTYTYNDTDTLNISINISCIDEDSNYNSSVYTLYIDNELPIINIYSPINDATYYSNVTYNISLIDDRLYNLNISLIYPNGTYKEIEYIEDINDSEYIYNDTDDYNYSAYPYGIYNLSISVCDDDNTSNNLNCNYYNLSYEYTYFIEPDFTLPEINQFSFLGSIPNNVEEVLMLFFLLSFCIAVSLFAGYDRARAWWFLSGFLWFIYGFVIMHYSFAFGLICVFGAIMLIFGKS